MIHDLHTIRGESNATVHVNLNHVAYATLAPEPKGLERLAGYVGINDYVIGFVGEEKLNVKVTDENWNAFKRALTGHGQRQASK